jgi:hypothetical protein
MLADTFSAEEKARHQAEASSDIALYNQERVEAGYALGVF